MIRRSLAAVLAVAAVLGSAACSTTDEAPVSPTTPGPTPQTPTPSGSTPTESPTPTTSSASPSLDPEAQKAAAFQLCGTVLALSAGFIGQVEEAQLAEGREAAEQARAAYVDDGSGLLQKADAVVAAVDDGTTPKVVTTSKALAAACKSVGPGE